MDPPSSLNYKCCDTKMVPDFTSVRSLELDKSVYENLLSRVLSLAKRVIRHEKECGGNEGVLAQLLQSNTLQMLTPEKLLVVRRVLSAVCTSDLGVTIEKLLQLIVEN